MAEKEYIERRALINDLNKFSDECEYYGEWEDCISSYEGDLLDIVEKAPTADVQEVRHGKWLYEASDIGWTDYKCSACGNIISTVDQDEDLYSYCPYCGAKMDKE